MDELIRPNWHMALVHFPIGLLVAGVLVEVFSFLGWRRSSFRTFGRWAILLGAIVAVPATFSGLHALDDVVPGGIAALELTDPIAAETLRDHLWMNSVATGAAMLLVVVWIALADVWRDRLSLVFKILLLLTLALVVIGAHHGGEIVYAHHIGPYEGGPASLPAALPDQPIDKLLDQALVSQQTHVVIAGFAIAMACVCLGWSIRAVAQHEDLSADDEAANAHRIAAAFAPDIGALIDPRGLLGHGAVSPNHTPPVRAGRFWFLTALLLLLAAGTGIWYLAMNESNASDGRGQWDVQALRYAITTPLEENGPQITRRFAHTISGAVLIGGSLLLALAATTARRNKWLLIMLAIPMIAALAIQVWLGILLVTDGPAGTVTKFNEPVSMRSDIAPMMSVRS